MQDVFGLDRLQGGLVDRAAFFEQASRLAQARAIECVADRARVREMRLRVAGTAELAGYDLSLDRTRCEALTARTFALFPDAGIRDSARYWTGLRPATPSNVPLIGRTRYRNLYVNTGHGTLGWTMACGSGRALADLIAGRRPAVEFAFTKGGAGG